MDNFTRQLFNGKCPYTDEPCKTTIDCLECEVNEEEQHLFEEEQGEQQDADSN